MNIVAEHKVPGTAGMYRGYSIRILSGAKGFEVHSLDAKGRTMARHTRIATVEAARTIANGIWTTQRDWNVQGEAEKAAKAALPAGTCKRCSGKGNTGHYREQGLCYGCRGTGRR